MISATSRIPDNYSSTSSHNLNEAPLFPENVTNLTNAFYEQSLLFAVNNQSIEEKFHQYKDLEWRQKFKIGVIKGCEGLVVSSIIIIGLRLALIGMDSGVEATTEWPSMLEGLAAAICEEVIFRGVLQNCLAGSQKIAIYFTPQCLHNNRVFKWFTSPSARIISINTIFAGLHLFNGGGYLNEKSSLIQACRIVLQPMNGILHETTGNIVAPIAYHMTTNFLIIGIFSLTKRIYNIS